MTMHTDDAWHTNLISKSVDRRSFLKRAAALGLATPAFAGLLAACGSDDDDEPATSPTEAPPAEATTAPEDDDDEPTEAPEEDDDEETTTPSEPAGDGEYGGKLVIATITQPPSFDIHQVTGRAVMMAMWHVYESLFTWDEDYGIMPLLADSWEVSEDDLTHTINLRQGVPFHNGDEMTSADVVASLDRWKNLSPLGQLLYNSVDEVVAVDDYTIEFNMTSPVGTVPQLLARGGQGAAIYPASVVEASGDDFVDEYIGTGPYQFSEFQADRFLRLTRFDDYVGPDSPHSGYSGQKIAYLDELEFIPVPDDAARVAGFRSGEYHYVEEVVADQIDQLRDDPSLVVDLLPIRSHGYIGLNHASGVFADLQTRKAFQAAMDVYPHGLASHGEGYFEVGGPTIMLPITVWNSDEGADLYNMADVELARQLLEESDYDGEPVRWVTTQEDLGDYNSAVVASQQAEEAGFTVELVVVDEATVASMRSQREGWDVWNGAFILRTDPTLLPYLSSCDWAGFWCSDEKEAAFETLLTESDFDVRFEAFETLQRLFHEEVGGIKQQDNYGILTITARLKNFGPETMLFQLEPEFVNAWLED